ncbi:hypothetical protein BS78_06G000700 [Paspalum vaginatum]|nr:hypothetical protein BS78_06G000700 [Paspalum vaginatum]
MTRAIALAPSSPRRKDPSKRPSTDPGAPVAKRTKRKPPPPPPSAAPPTSPGLKEPPPNARPLERRTSQEASILPTARPAKNREAPTEGNKRKARPPPDTSGAMADPPAKRKTGGQFQRTWSPRDEVRILEALATHGRAHGGALPTAAELFESLGGRLEKQGVDARELNLKQHSLKRRYDRDTKKNTPPADEHERRLYLLSRDVWGDDSPPNLNPYPPSVQNDGTSDTGELTGVNHAAEAKSAGKQAGMGARTLDEMRKLYPHLVRTARLLFDSAVTERMLLAIDDNEAQVVDKKIKKAREQLTEAIMKSARMKNMETSTVFLCQSTELQPERSRMDKKDGLDIFAQERLAQLERDIVELKRIVMASQYQEKIEINSLHDNSSVKIPQKKKEVSNGLPHGKNEEVTSKYKYNGVVHDHLKLKGLTKPPLNTFHGRMRKIDAESQILHNVKLQGLVKPSSNTFHGRTGKIDAESQTLHNAKLQGLVKPSSNTFHGRTRKINAESQTLHNAKLQGVVKPPLNTFHGRTRKIDAQSQTLHNMDGKEVVLCSIVRPHGPVGKAILQNSSPSSIVGGMKLGSQYCKVFVCEVLNRDALLLCPNGKMERMLDALNCSIAWPSVLIQDSAIASKAAPDQAPHQGY